MGEAIMMSEKERRNKQVSRPQVKTSRSPTDRSSNDMTTVLHDRQRAWKARKQLPFHVLAAYLHIDDVL